MFSKELASIKNKGIRDFTRFALENAPKYFWVVPSSSSGKYHPPQSRGTGGLARHTKSIVVFAGVFSRMYSLTGRENDVVVSACLLHDIVKYGVGEMKPHTTKTHDKEGADYVHQLGRHYITTVEGSELEKDDLIEICKAMAWHMGQWTTQDRAKAFPSEFTLLEVIVHGADMMSACKDVVLISLQEPAIG